MTNEVMIARENDYLRPQRLDRATMPANSLTGRTTLTIPKEMFEILLHLFPLYSWDKLFYQEEDAFFINLLA